MNNASEYCPELRSMDFSHRFFRPGAICFQNALYGLPFLRVGLVIVGGNP